MNDNEKTYIDEKGAIFSEDRKTLLEAPSEVREYEVPEGTEEIGKYAFDNKIRKVKLPQSLKKIWPHAFDDTSHLMHMEIPDSVEEIGEDAFFHSGLREIIVPKSLTEIGKGAFYYCYRMERVVIHDSVTIIGEYAFGSCCSLKEIALPNSIETIADNAFCSCHSLETFQLPEGLQTIIGNPFYGCEMTITSISPKFKVIDNALYGDYGKTLIHVSRVRERFCVAEGTELIDRTSLNLITDELVIPASVKEIRWEYERECTARSIIFKGKVEKMPEVPIYEVFSDLKRVTIPRGTRNHYNKVFNFAIDESD